MKKYTFTLPADYTGAVEEYIKRRVKTKVTDLRILKKSLDARNKREIKYLYTVAFSCENEFVAAKNGAQEYEWEENALDKLVAGKKYVGARPVVVGAGPCGLFACLTLAKLGARPILLERGKSVDERAKSVEEFFSTGVLDEESNVLFGAGGAGTFSDGKLATGTNNPYVDTVLRELRDSGAPEEIVYLNKPHVGTDRLRDVVKNLDKRIRECGGEIFYQTKVEDILVENGNLVGLRTNRGDFLTDRAYFAVGHSARDTFEMLYRRQVRMTPKIFSMGVRIEHKQEDIDFARYGRARGTLPPADYKAAVDVGNGQKLYTFCMCPGGVVVNASSERGGINVNGMSYYARDGKNANSAILVNVSEADFGEHPLAGVEYQRVWERRAYLSSGSFRAPAQTFADFLTGQTKGFSDVSPTCLGGVVNADLNAVLPEKVLSGIKIGVPLIARQIGGYDEGSAVLTGPETRSSCPVRTLRDEKGCSSVVGLYPMGEGAGYAGGITSAAADGIRIVLNSLT